MTQHCYVTIFSSATFSTAKMWIFHLSLNDGCHLSLFTGCYLIFSEIRNVILLSGFLESAGFRSFCKARAVGLLWLLPVRWSILKLSNEHFRELQPTCKLWDWRQCFWSQLSAALLLRIAYNATQ